MSVVLIQLNEINFCIVKKYINKGYKLDTLENIYLKSINTFENEDYKNLEPWIQWTTCFRGKTFKNHKIFRLGDGLNSKVDNIFTDFKKKLNKSCAAICPMNISSGGLNFDFFIPDPWSDEKTIGDFSLRLFSQAVKKGVNNNASSRNQLLTKIKLVIGLIFNLKLSDFKDLLKYYSTINSNSYRRALLLDYILVLLHQHLLKRKKTEFSTIFLNAGAHIQHHYFLNSKVLQTKLNPDWYIDENKDPVLEALMLYDRLIFSYRKLGYKIILMTGLQQVPTERSEFYYRLDKHDDFLNYLRINFIKVLPRMTRDFEILFSSNSNRDYANKILSSIVDNQGERLFGEIELREKSIFCSLTYNKEISRSMEFFLDKNNKFKPFSWINFVAIKNGIHDKNGYLFMDQVDLKSKLGGEINLAEVRELILRESINYYS